MKEPGQDSRHGKEDDRGESYRLHLGAAGDLLGLLLDIVDTTAHVEGGLGESIVVTMEDLLAGGDSVLERDELTLDTSEDLGDSERLAHETLHLTGTLDGELVLFREFVHTKNGDDVLERLVVLEELLDTGGNVVVLTADDGGVKHTGLGVEGVDGGVDTKLGNTTRQHSGGVQVGEGGGGGRVSQVIGGHVNGLHGGNGTLLGGGNSLLHDTHVGGKGRLVTYGGGDTTEKSRGLGTGLGETENVVNEEKHILSLLVTEVLGDGKTGKSDTGTGSGGLVHLTEDESDLGVTLEVDDTSLDHLVVEIVTLTGTLTDTGEDGVTTVGLGNVVDKLLDKHSLTDTGTTEETNLTTTGVRGEEVDDLDTGLENLSLGGLVNERGGLDVDGGNLGALDGSTLVHGLADDVHDTTESTGADGDLDGETGVKDLLATNETFGTLHGDGTDGVLTKVLGDLENETTTTKNILDLEGVKDSGELLGVELNIDDGTNDGLDGTGLALGGSLGGESAGCQVWKIEIEIRGIEVRTTEKHASKVW